MIENQFVVIAKCSLLNYEKKIKLIESELMFCFMFVISAVTVRYLTKRYIGEYSSTTGKLFMVK